MPENRDYSQKSDEELAVLALGDPGLFSHLIERYQEKLARYIRRISGVSIQETEDLLQDVFIKVYQNLNDFDDSLKFSSWIYRVAHNETISNFRRKKARPQNAILEDSQEFLSRLASDFNLEKEINRRELKDTVGKALEQIDEKYREVLVLRFFEEKDYREISDILKKPIGTVAAWLNRAKKQLKEHLE